jgi:hypothetical protein
MEVDLMEIELQNIMKKIGNTVLVIEEILKSKNNFNKILDTFYEYITIGFEIKEFRSQPIRFRFHPDDEMIYELEIRHFITNLMFWEAHMKLEVVNDLNAEFIFDCTKISTAYIKLYIDNKIIKPYRKNISNKKLNLILHDVLFNLARISNDFNIILGMSINMETFMDVANKNPRFNEIIRTKLDDTMQPNEIEHYLNTLMKEEIEILTKEDNLLAPILRSKTGIKDKQLLEFSIHGGLIISPAI